MTIYEAQRQIQKILSVAELDNNIVVSDVELVTVSTIDMDGTPKFTRHVRINCTPGPGKWGKTE